MALNNKFILLLTLIILSNIQVIFAENKVFFKKDKYCYDNKLGWKFYCDDVEEQEDNEEKINTTTTKTYSEKLIELQKLVEESKAKAVLEPTDQNVKDYMFLQQKVVNQASYFSDIWRRVLWSTPELDYTQQRPISGVGKNVWQTERENKILSTLKNINKRYGIFFVYSTQCSFCQQYAKILYNLKQNYKIEIKGISIDGKFLPLWENDSFVNKEQLKKLGIDYSTVPITFLYDNLTNSIILVGYGLLTQDELMSRIYVLTQTKIGEDY